MDTAAIANEFQGLVSAKRKLQKKLADEKAGSKLTKAKIAEIDEEIMKLGTDASDRLPYEGK